MFALSRDLRGIMIIRCASSATDNALVGHAARPNVALVQGFHTLLVCTVLLQVQGAAQHVPAAQTDPAWGEPVVNAVHGLTLHCSRPYAMRLCELLLAAPVHKNLAALG